MLSRSNHAGIRRPRAKTRASDPLAADEAMGADQGVRPSSGHRLWKTALGGAVLMVVRRDGMVAFMRLALVVAAAVVVACSSALSAVGSSDDLDALPTDSGFVMAFAFDAGAPGAVYAATLGGDVFKSTERGRPLAFYDVGTGLVAHRRFCR